MNQKVKLLIVVVNIILGIVIIFNALQFGLGKYGATQTNLANNYRKSLSVEEFNTLCQGRLGQEYNDNDPDRLLCTYKSYTEYARDYNDMKEGATTISETQRVRAQQQLPIFLSLAFLAIAVGLLNIIAATAFRKQRKWSAVCLISINSLVFVGTAFMAIAILFSFGEIYILAMALMALFWLIFEGLFVKKHWQEFN